MGWCGLDWSGSGLGPVDGSCECGNESSGFVKCGEVHDKLHTWQLLKKSFAPRN
jgi:hypothetical protein